MKRFQAARLSPNRGVATIGKWSSLLTVAGLLSACAGAPGPTVMAQLPRFSAPGVPAVGPAEVAIPPKASATPNPPIPPNLPGRGLAQHPMLYIGEGDNRIYILNKGKVVWTYSTGPGNELDDVWMLSNGNILYSRMQYVAEVTPEKQVVWRYDVPAGTELHAAQPIGLDKVLFILNGDPAKLMVMNIKTGQVEVQHDLLDSRPPDRSVHAEFRRARYTSQGTYLIPYLEKDQVVEYDKDFNVVWQYNIPTPWAAVRLKNGNTLITDEHDILTREVNPKGETVWELKPEDLPEAYRFGNTQSATRLSNGNTIICSRGGKNRGPQLVEVTPDKRVVWVLQDWQHLGPATAVQVLDDPGLPEIPGQSEH